MTQKSDLPFGSEFSPSQIDLPTVLNFANEHGGDWRAFENAVYEFYFKEHETTESNRRKLANNTKLGMQAYGIIDKDARLTNFGRELHGIRNDEQGIHEMLARHILVNLHGTTLILCIKDMEASGETVTLLKLRSWLEERGVHFPRGGKHPSIMRLWLERAGVFTERWRVNQVRYEKLLGIGLDEVDALVQLSREQRFYLRTMINLEGTDSPYRSNEVEKLATATYGIRFDEKNLPKQVLYPLREAGYIKAERAKGHGAKPFLISPTEKLKVEILDPLLVQIEQQVMPDLRPFLRKPIETVVKELKSSNRQVKGLALEAFAVKLMRLIDLRYRYTRLRGAATGGAEVDVIFESDRLVFSRWQVQCKNTASVSLDDVAKEVGRGCPIVRRK